MASLEYAVVAFFLHFFAVFLKAQSFTITSTPSSPVYIKNGEDLSLDIKHDYTGSKTVGVHWKKNSLNVLRKYITGTLQHDDQRASLKGDGVSLLLKNITLQDNATFEVELTVEGIGDASVKNIKVVVTEQPVAQLDGCNKYNEVNQGDNFSCVCKSEVGNPTPVASWVKDNKVVVSGNIETTLSIRNIAESDAGTYTCKVKSYDLSNEIAIIIKANWLFAPTKVFFSNGNTAFLSKAFTIICQAEGNPEPTYTLSHNDLPPFVIDKGKHLITSAKYKDAGKWTCEATNKRGKASGSFNLTVSNFEKFEKSGGSTLAYVIVLTFIGGTVFGMVLLYGIFLVRRWLLKRKTIASNDQHSCHDYENAGVAKNTTYQELDISKMNAGENYQSLKMNSRSLKHNETPRGVANDFGLGGCHTIMTNVFVSGMSQDLSLQL